MNTSERERRRSSPESSPAAPVPERAPGATDVKIAELEQRLEELKGLRQEESDALLTEMREREAYLREQQQFKVGAEPTSERIATTPAETAPTAAAGGQISAAALLGLDPVQAVQSLFDLATSNARGFERAVQLLREIARHPGGAWIVDQFHAQMAYRQQRSPDKSATP